VHVILVNLNTNFLTAFRKIQIPHIITSFQCSMRTNEQTDVTNAIDAFRNF